MRRRTPPAASAAFAAARRRRRRLRSAALVASPSWCPARSSAQSERRSGRRLQEGLRRQGEEHPVGGPGRRHRLPRRRHPHPPERPRRRRPRAQPQRPGDQERRLPRRAHDRRGDRRPDDPGAGTARGRRRPPSSASRPSRRSRTCRSPPRTTASPTDRYNMFNACYGLQSTRDRTLAGRRQRADLLRHLASAPARPLYFKPTELGRYLLYSQDRTYLDGGDGRPRRTPRARPEQRLGRARCRKAGQFMLPDPRQGLPDRRRGRTPRSPAPAPRCGCSMRSGCADFPEVSTNVSGNPFSGVSTTQEVRGFIDAHTHGMAFEFLGGDVHCGRPWSPYGVEVGAAGLPRPRPDQRQRRGDGGLPLRQRRPTTRSAGRPSRTGRRRTR